jgi:hypothetical protein
MCVIYSINGIPAIPQKGNPPLQRAKSREQRALFKEQRAGSKEQSEDGDKISRLTLLTAHISFLTCFPLFLFSLFPFKEPLINSLFL